MLLAHWERALSPACLPTLEHALEQREPSRCQQHAAGPSTRRTVAEHTHSLPPAPTASLGSAADGVTLTPHSYAQGVLPTDRLDTELLVLSGSLWKRYEFLELSPLVSGRSKRGSLQLKRVLEKLSPGLLTSTLFWEHDQGLCPFPPGPFLRRTAVVPAGGRRFCTPHLTQSARPQL